MGFNITEYDGTVHVLGGALLRVVRKEEGRRRLLVGSVLRLCVVHPQHAHTMGTETRQSAYAAHWGRLVGGACSAPW